MLIPKDFVCASCGKTPPSRNDLELAKAGWAVPSANAFVCKRPFARWTLRCPECESERHSEIDRNIEAERLPMLDACVTTAIVALDGMNAPDVYARDIDRALGILCAIAEKRRIGWPDIEAIKERMARSAAWDRKQRRKKSNSGAAAEA